MTCSPWRRHSSSRLIGCVALLIAAVGCGPKHPVTVPVSGFVAFADGSPVRGGMIEFESETGGINARGTLNNDGEFVLSTFGDGDGAVVGRHKVIVQQTVSAFVGTNATVVHQPHARPPLYVPLRYGDYATSKLTAEVTTDSNQRIILKIDEEEDPRRSDGTPNHR